MSGMSESQEIQRFKEGPYRHHLVVDWASSQLTGPSCLGTHLHPQFSSLPESTLWYSDCLVSSLNLSLAQNYWTFWECIQY